MNKVEKISIVVVLWISCFTALLFIYAGVSKMVAFEEFQAQLGQSPLTSVYAGWISYTLIAIELVIAFLLCFSSTRSLALKASSFLMLLFTAYIFIILNFSTHIPCSCGGILEQLDWHSHLWFNVVVELFIIAALILQSKSVFKTIVLVLVQIVVSGALTSVLYFSSEHFLQKENPFVRRFSGSAATKQITVKLPNNTLYFAGSDSGSIYLGDAKAPLHLISYDTLLQTKQIHKIALDVSDYSFKSVQVQVQSPYFYVLDGTVPVVYRGVISDWKAKTVISEQGFYFSKAVVVDSCRLVFRTQQEFTGENALGVMDFSQGVQTRLDTTLLQKQIDGFFDTDGMLQYDLPNQTFAYLYYYRNQFIVTDAHLTLKYRGNTIDTTSRAKLLPVYISETKQRKLASPAMPVNKSSYLSNNRLYVHALLRGKFEPKEMWDIASIIDVYDLAKKQYLYSFYLYTSKDVTLVDLMVVGETLYAIVGNELHKYKLRKFKQKQ